MGKVPLQRPNHQPEPLRVSWLSAWVLHGQSPENRIPLHRTDFTYFAHTLRNVDLNGPQGQKMGSRWTIGLECSVIPCRCRHLAGKQAGKAGAEQAKTKTNKARLTHNQNKKANKKQTNKQTNQQTNQPTKQTNQPNKQTNKQTNKTN